MSLAPWYLDDPAFRAACRQFADFAADEADQPLTAVADQFLSAQDINEPAFAQPDLTDASPEIPPSG